MKKKTKRRKYQQSKKQHNYLIIIVFFILTAISIIGLEYIKFNKGKESFIFKRNKTKIITKKQKIGVIFDDKIQLLLNKNRIKYNHFIDPNWNYHHYKIDLENIKYNLFIKKIKAQVEKFHGIFEEIERVEKEKIYLYSISFNNKLSHKILITVNKKKEKKIIPQQTKTIEKGIPKIAFIIDDIGNNTTDANNLKNCGIPITGSVIPYTPYANQEATKINAFGLQTMLHIPMQAKDPNLQYPKEHFILINSSFKDIIRIIDNARKIVPFAKGMNNHMGSLVTSHRETISRVLTIAKKRGLFFVDSRTTTTTVAAKISRSMGIKTAEKDLFIDHIQTYEHTRKQIEKLIRIALYKGKGIAIGHPHPTTFKAIRDSVSLIKSKGIKIVFVSELLK